MEASACSCITLSPVHEAKEPKSPQMRCDAEVDGATKEKVSANIRGATSRSKKRSLFRKEEDETIRVAVKSAADTD